MLKVTYLYSFKLHTMVAVLTYNQFAEVDFPYPCGLGNTHSVMTLILQGVFTKEGQKSPDFVTPHHPMFRLLATHKDSLTKVIVFIGKEESGSFKMIDLLLETFEDSRSLLFFVLCRHVPEYKYKELLSEGILPTNIFQFTDGHEQCRESIVLEGFLLYYIRQELQHNAAL